MKRSCLRCGFENEQSNGSAFEACPKCGVIYSKAEAAAAAKAVHAAPPARSQAEVPPATGLPRNQHSAAVYWIFGIAIFVAGFFAGREQMRYQMAAAIIEGIGNAFGGLDSPKRASPSPAQEEPPKPQPLTVSVSDKRFADRDFSDALTFKATFTNKSGKEIRAFDGRIHFTDLLGNTVLGAKVEINESVAIGGSLVWNAELEYNQFMASHQRLRSEPLENLKVEFKARKVLFADGSAEEFSD